MKTGGRHQCLPLLAQRVVAIGCVAAVFILAVLAASPQLHELIHPDAQGPGHECAVTLFIHGVESGPAALVLVTFLPVVLARIAPAPAELLLAAPRPGCSQHRRAAPSSSAGAGRAGA